MKKALQEPYRTGMKKRMRLLTFVMCIFIAWAGYNIWDQMEVLSEKEQKLNALQEKLVEVQTENKHYKLEITRLNDPEYIEQRLRKDLHMTKEGETLFYKVNVNDDY